MAKNNRAKTAEKDIYRTLGENISFFRNRMSMTLEALAHLAGISTSYLANIEKAHKKPTLKTVLAISGALDMDVATVLTYSINSTKLTESDLVMMNIRNLLSKKSLKEKEKIYKILKQL